MLLAEFEVHPSGELVHVIDVGLQVGELVGDLLPSPCPNCTMDMLPNNNGWVELQIHLDPVVCNDGEGVVHMPA